MYRWVRKYLASAAVSMTFIPLDTKQCDKMLWHEKGYKKEKAG
jgi:hypothetical protein